MYNDVNGEKSMDNITKDQTSGRWTAHTADEYVHADTWHVYAEPTTTTEIQTRMWQFIAATTAKDTGDIVQGCTDTKETVDTATSTVAISETSIQSKGMYFASTTTNKRPTVHFKPQTRQK